MRTLFAVIAFLLLTSARAQEGKKYTFKEVGWTIVLPAGFKVLDSVTDATNNEQGRQKIEAANGIKVDGTIKTLISATKGQAYFNATLTPYNPKNNGGWKATVNFGQDLLYNSIVASIPSTATIDSSTTVESVKGVSFQKFHVIASVNDRVMHCFLYARLHKQSIFAISYVYSDEETGKQLVHMIETSYFR